jgi:glycosyltransferase involved in cell wall biosynthesis
MKEQEPLVSIILPVYNGEKTLKVTLDSLMSQTFQNFEILVGIDGTTDGSKAIAESYNDSRIKIYENPQNLGLGPNLNEIITHVHDNAKYLAMAEQDDYYVPERLQWQVDVLEANINVGMVSGIVEYKHQHGSVLFPGLLVHGQQFPEGEDLFKYLYTYQLKVVNTCMMWRKSIHQKHHLKFTNRYPNMNIDWDFIIRFSLISKIYGIPKVLVRMNRSLNNSSVTRNKKLQHETTRRLLLDLKADFPEIVKEKDYNKALKEHRKIEIGHHSKYKIVLYALYYSIIYADPYFLKYMIMRIRKYSKSA